MIRPRVILRQCHAIGTTCHAFECHKRALFRSALKMAAYYTRHANAEAKPLLLAQCVTFSGSEGTYPVSEYVSAT